MFTWGSGGTCDKSVWPGTILQTYILILFLASTIESSTGTISAWGTTDGKIMVIVFPVALALAVMIIIILLVLVVVCAKNKTNMPQGTLAGWQ